MALNKPNGINSYCTRSETNPNKPKLSLKAINQEISNNNKEFISLLQQSLHNQNENTHTHTENWKQNNKAEKRVFTWRWGLARLILCLRRLLLFSPPKHPRKQPILEKKKILFLLLISENYRFQMTREEVHGKGSPSLSSEKRRWEREGSGRGRVKRSSYGGVRVFLF